MRAAPHHPRKEDLVFSEPAPESKSERAQLARLLRLIQALTFELRESRGDAGPRAELRTKERELEQLRWQLAAIARRAATDDLGNAA
jgi:hypothetical protein